jgi:hypothetical protein
VRTRTPVEVGSRDLPLNAELDTEGTSREWAECTGDDPERDEHCDEEDEDAGERRDQIQMKFVHAAIRT